MLAPDIPIISLTGDSQPSSQNDAVKCTSSYLTLLLTLQWLTRCRYRNVWGLYNLSPTTLGLIFYCSHPWSLHFSHPGRPSQYSSTMLRHPLTLRPWNWVYLQKDSSFISSCPTSFKSLFKYHLHSKDCNDLSTLNFNPAGDTLGVCNASVCCELEFSLLKTLPSVLAKYMLGHLNALLLWSHRRPFLLHRYNLKVWRSSSSPGATLNQWGVKASSSPFSHRTFPPRVTRWSN